MTGGHFVSEASHPIKDPATASAALRERVYSTLTGLSTVLVLLGYADSTTPLSAATSVGVTMGGLWAASLVADIVAHSASHGAPPERRHRASAPRNRRSRRPGGGR